jgi:hypothetical protein
MKVWLGIPIPTLLLRIYKAGEINIMDLLVDIINTLHFYQALTIVTGIFISDIFVGLVAAASSGRKIKSEIMVACQDRKFQSFFRYIIIGVGLYFAASIGTSIGHDDTSALEALSTVTVLIPAIPEFISIFENFKIIRTKVDNKPKGNKQ